MQDYPLQAKGVRKGVHGIGLGKGLLDTLAGTEAYTGDGILAGIFLPERPVREPQQVLVLLPDAVVLQALVLAQIRDELVKAGIDKELKGNVRLEGLHMMLESKPALVGGIGPLLHGSLLSGEFIEHLEESLLPGLLRLGAQEGRFYVQIPVLSRTHSMKHYQRKS